jgi:hypothetical protein
MKQSKSLRAEFETIEVKFENGNDDHQLIFDLEEKVQMAMDESMDHNLFEFNSLKKLIKDIKYFKEEYEFFDAEAELNSMFPNRGDDDFDDESTSYESVFGDD